MHSYFICIIRDRSTQDPDPFWDSLRVVSRNRSNEHSIIPGFMRGVVLLWIGLGTENEEYVLSTRPS